MYAFIADRVHKNDRGESSRPVDLLDKIDEEEEWLLGKIYGEKRGRKRVLVGVKATSLCRAAKAIKHGGRRGHAPMAVITRFRGGEESRDRASSRQARRLHMR